MSKRAFSLPDRFPLLFLFLPPHSSFLAGVYFGSVFLVSLQNLLVLDWPLGHRGKRKRYCFTVSLKVTQSELDRDKFQVTLSSSDHKHIHAKYSGNSTKTLRLH